MIHDIDSLQLFRGKDYVINKYLSIHQPTLDEICNYGEQEYFTLVSLLVSTPSDLKLQLFDMGIDYEEVGEFDLFMMLCQGITPNRSKILLGNFNFQDLTKSINVDTQEHILFNKTTGCIIDRVIYELLSEYLRKIHGFKKNIERAGNAITKQIMIDEARREKERNANKPYKSSLMPLISALTNLSEFKFGFKDVWDLPIYAFMDSVKRIQKIRYYNFLMSGAYSGNVDMKKISKSELDWMGEV